jgi:hypothetical protein
MYKLFLERDCRGQRPIIYRRVIGKVWKVKERYEKKVIITDELSKSRIVERVILKVIRKIDNYIVVEIVGL